MTSVINCHFNTKSLFFFKGNKNGIVLGDMQQYMGIPKYFQQKKCIEKPFILWILKRIDTKHVYISIWYKASPIVLKYCSLYIVHIFYFCFCYLNLCM